MRIVVDTNVLMSGVFFGGLPGRILDAWRSGQFDIAVSPEIVEEYYRVSGTLSKQYPRIDIDAILALLTQNAVLVPARPLQESACEDHDDDKFLACALAGKAAVVISGDKKLRTVSGYRGIEVISPRSFVDKHL